MPLLFALFLRQQKATEYAMISAPVPKNTGFIPDFKHFEPVCVNFCANSKAAKPKGDLNANTALFAMNCAPVAEITGFCPCN